MQGQDVRGELLQRIPHVIFRTNLLVSHDKTWPNISEGGCVRFSSRALLYVCDQPEDNAVMCLKESDCLFPCTACTVWWDSSCTEAGTDAPSRDLHKTVRAQLCNVLKGDLRGAGATRAGAQMDHRYNSMIPALNAWTRLGNSPRMLYRFPGCDCLPVRFSAMRVSCRYCPVSLSGLCCNSSTHQTSQPSSSLLPPLYCGAACAQAQNAWAL